MNNFINVKEYNIPSVISVQIGKLGNFDGEPRSKPARQQCLTGFYKEPVSGKIWVGNCSLSGDSQADLKNHGGADKAVLAYSAEHYPAWRKERSISDLPYGGFGENLTIAGMTRKNRVYR